MSINFVSTSVLESEDGLDFGKETQKDTTELKELKIINSNAGKSLYDQLAAHRSEKEEEYEQKGRLLRAPQAGLEEDDIEYFGELEAKSLAVQTEREERDHRELNNFLEMKSRIGDHGREVKTKSLLTRKTSREAKKKLDANSLPLVVGKKKRRSGDEDDANKKCKKTEKQPSFAVKELLAGYSSDSD